MAKRLPASDAQLREMGCVDATNDLFWIPPTASPNMQEQLDSVPDPVKRKKIITGKKRIFFIVVILLAAGTVYWAITHP